jgi:hypothetical protein
MNPNEAERHLFDEQDTAAAVLEPYVYGDKAGEGEVRVDEVGTPR